MSQVQVVDRLEVTPSVALVDTLHLRQSFGLLRSDQCRCLYPMNHTQMPRGSSLQPPLIARRDHSLHLLLFVHPRVATTTCYSASAKNPSAVLPMQRIHEEACAL